jgi:Zn-dependent protease
LPFSGLQGFFAAIPAILVAITFHEYAHGKVAYFLGDQTAKYQGRLTLNPIKHLDPIGTLLLIIAGFGWAKPVQVNPLQFKGDRKMGMTYVAFAGPLMNLVLGYLSAVALRYLLTSGYYGPGAAYLQQFFYLLLFYNVILAVFNLLPIPPLDGSKILAGLLPYKYYGVVQFLERYGFAILIILIVTPVIDLLLGRPVRAIIDFFIYLSGFTF